MAAAIPRFKHLHDKVLSLSIAIEDNTESITILQNAIRENDESIGPEHTASNAKYRVLFDESAKKNERILSNLLTSCSKLVKQKEQITVTINKLIQEKKEEEQKTNLELTSIYNEVENQLGDKFKFWKRGEKERRDQWIAENTERVRRETVKALEPEVKKLINKNKIEIGDITTVFETKRRHVEKENEIALQLRIRQQLMTSAENKNRRSDERRDYWEQQLLVLNRTNLQSIEETKKDLLNLEEREKSRENSELQIEVDKYEFSIRNMQEECRKHIDRLRTDHEKRVKESIQDKQQAEVKISQEAANKKSKWKDEKKASMRGNMEKEMVIRQGDILKDRDNSIDNILRAYNKKENTLTMSNEMKTTSSKNNIVNCHKDVLNSIRDDIEMMKDSLSHSYEGMEILRLENQKVADQIETEEERLKHLKEQIVLVKQKNLKLEEETSERVDSINAAKRNVVVEHLSKQRRLSDTIRKMEQELSAFERYVNVFS